MKTQMLSAQRPEDIAAAAGLLRNGKLVAIPTETVYGLGANGLDENAVLRIFEAKGRPQDNPLILHISEPKELESICHDIPAQAWLLAEHFWPGPLTMVLPVRDLVPKRTTAGLDTVAVRCPKTAATRELIRLAGVPIAAPSANRSGKPSTTTAAHVLHDMDGRIEAILDGGPCEVGVESTIVDLTGEHPRILRPGAVTPRRGSADAAGYDLYACPADGQSVTIAPHATAMIGTGLALAIPAGYFGGVFARSGLASKQGLRPANCLGVIDSDYRGEIQIGLHNLSAEPYTVQPGERIAQMIIMPYFAPVIEEVTSLTETDRGAGGFGSTGTK